ncbi:bolA-like protein 2 isoform X1 [Sciurus carolinensis]|uniref:bolA-like protein 2 isoform X1 n=1 Tax=Sciurus carolinensis TaxID=30640 RepID=UPI001FB34773|nr:bolA-like protein 2 isoform X1 [Sciurus carolinensis]
MELSADYLREKLQRDLEAEHVEVEDTTPGRCATSFRVLVVSAKFEGKPLLHRHRNVAQDPMERRTSGTLPVFWVTLASGTATQASVCHFSTPRLNPGW